MAKQGKGKRHCLAWRCGALVDMPAIFCPSHWYRLPGEIRVLLWEAHSKADGVVVLSLVEDAIAYLRAQDIQFRWRPLSSPIG